MPYNKLITVLLPVYNGEAYLGDAIDSILEQTYSNFELLIINDGSTDATEKIIQRYTDPRIRYIKNERNIKLIETLNKGIELVYGEYIARMDADDISLPERLQRQFDFMESNAEIAVCGTDYQILGSEDIYQNPGQHHEIMVALLQGSAIAHPTAMFRTEEIKKHAYFYDPAFLHAEDYELWYRIGQQSKLANINEVLLLYRKHDNSIGSFYSVVQQETDLKIKRIQYEFILSRYLSEVEENAFLQINSNNSIGFNSFAEVDRLIKKLYNANTRNRVLNEPLFIDFLVQKWVTSFLRVTQFEIGLLRIYLTHPLRRRISYAKGITLRYIFSKAIKSLVQS